MENNLPVMSKRIWSIVRIVYLLRKGISKGKLMMDLSMIMKRGKIAGKVISNLMFNHHHHGASTSSHHHHDSNLSFSGPREYEFSCSNTPNYNFFPIIKRNRHGHSHFFPCAHAPLTQDDETVTGDEVKAALEMLNNRDDAMVEASPALPGFGRTPMVRHLRITDSPFPLTTDTEDDNHVDEEAEKFIKRFYRELRNQRTN